jgi:hypothetical protein
VSGTFRNFDELRRIYLGNSGLRLVIMSWQAFSWTEIQARTPGIPERLLSRPVWIGSHAYDLLSFVALFLTPFTFMEAALGFWRLGADLGWAGSFFIDAGILSHWQVWFALAAFTQVASSYLNRLLEQKPELAELDGQAK